MSRCKLFVFFIFLSAPIWAGKQSEEIVIKLKAPNQLTLVHMEDVHYESDVIDEAYTLDLQRILHFDLNHNGKMRTLKAEEIKDLPQKKKKTGDPLQMEKKRYCLCGIFLGERSIFHAFCSVYKRRQSLFCRRH